MCVDGVWMVCVDGICGGCVWIYIDGEWIEGVDDVCVDVC